MIRILHIISDKNIGGAGRLLLNLLAEASQSDFCFTVALPRGSRLSPQLSALGVDTAECDLSFFELAEIIKEKRPQIVHTHAAAVARMVARLCGCVTVNTRHCADDRLISPPLHKILARRLFDALFTDVTIATAHYAARSLRSEGVPQGKIWTVINGSRPLRLLSAEERAVTRRRLGYSEDDFLVGMVARLEHGKGHGTMIRAAEICRGLAQDIKFLVVGDGSLKNELSKMARGLSNVKFLGFVDDVTEIMNVIDVDLNCSHISETSSLSLSEGMSVGAVPVVSDCGGNSFMAEGCGIVFPKNDHVALADALTGLSGSPRLCRELSKKARERFLSHFTAEKMAKETEKLYFELLKFSRS